MDWFNPRLDSFVTVTLQEKKKWVIFLSSLDPLALSQLKFLCIQDLHKKNSLNFNNLFKIISNILIFLLGGTIFYRFNSSWLENTIKISQSSLMVIGGMIIISIFVYGLLSEITYLDFKSENQTNAYILSMIEYVEKKDTKN